MQKQNPILHCYFADSGLTELLGTDLSPQMVAVARELNPQLHFEVADILDLPYPDQSFGSAVAFYAIVHFDYGQLKTAFQEIKRVLTDGGEFLFSFHIGDHTVHLDKFLDQPVDIDFYFFEPDQVAGLLAETGFEIIDHINRQPYAELEYPSRRAYFWARIKQQ